MEKNLLNIKLFKRILFLKGFMKKYNLKYATMNGSEMKIVDDFHISRRDSKITTKKICKFWQW